MSENITQLHDNLPIVVLVGRVNVGKSTLFNRLTEQFKAMVSPIPGTTRTNNEGIVVWRGKSFRIIDTGGLTFDEEVPLEKEIIEQSERALKNADLVLLVTDAIDGVLPQEYELAKRLRQKSQVPVLLVANKVDKASIEPNIHSPEWRKFALGEAFPVSSNNGRNVGELLEEIYKHLNKASVRPKVIKELDEGEVIQVSLIGKPNVGKSSLFNKLIGEEKVIVSPMAHTTREPHDTLVVYKYHDGDTEVEQKINFIDTAGIRRKSKVDVGLEKQGIGKSLTSLEESSIILFVIDGSEPITHQDMQLGGLMERHSKSVLILINKWDLAEDNSDHARNEVKKMISSYFPHLDFAPLIFVSGKTGYRVHDIFPHIIRAWKSRHIKLANRILERFIEKSVKEHRPARGKGTRHPEIMGFRQININPPIFEMFIKQKTSIHRSYVEFIENRLREEFDFYGTPVVIKLTKMKRA